MATNSSSNVIRILISTDNHVGYNERDAERGDDSWKTFDEIMRLAKSREVDMVLLAGDLFHDNKPSRKSMYQVMRSLRMNCLGEKPCELEMLSDGTENFHGAFNHVNYEDEDINVAIPVFSIHGNHDDPSGEGHLAALDILQISGLLNYYGRTPESDNIQVKPVLLQKGRTKLALYGMSNVRDERLFRTFRDQKVKFFKPTTQEDDWFNLLSVHQNHHAYTESGYLPETFLPGFMDLVVWGHEHECIIDPTYNPEMDFHVMQPGSSVATSLMPGEAVTKHVAILSVTGKEFKCESIRLKTVRPFLMREIILQDDPDMKKIAKKDNNRTPITQYLIKIVQGMIDEAQKSWLEAHDQDEGIVGEESEPPLPLIRLRVEYTPPEGGKFDCENPQRFSNRFVGKVANVNDVVQFHRKKASTGKKSSAQPDMPEQSTLSQLSIDTVKVEELVRNYLTLQSLTILPQNSFGDAVTQFVEKDDKHAMEMFVSESLKNQVTHLVGAGEVDEDSVNKAMEEYKSRLEDMFNKGHHKRFRRGKLKPRDPDYDSDLDGPWEDNIHAYEVSDAEAANVLPSDDEPVTTPSRKAPASKSKSVSTKAAPKRAAQKTTGKSRRRSAADSDENGMSDDVMMDEDDFENDMDDVEDDGLESQSQGLFVSNTTRKTAPKTTAKRPASPKARGVKTKAPAKTTRTSNKQSTLQFSQPMANGGVSSKKPITIDDDIEDDDDDAFEPAPATSRATRSRR